MVKQIIFLLSFCISATFVEAQADTLFNRRDEAGRRQGIWKGMMERKDTTYLYNIENFVDDKLSGLCRYFFPNGKVNIENSMLNGKLNGLTRVYRPNGFLHYEVNFTDDKEDGLKKFYSYDGYLEEEQEYSMGKQTGVYRRYSKSKRVVAESHVVDGIENGTRRIYADTDQHEILREFDFKNDVKIAARYYKKGKVVKQETFDYEEGLKKDLEIKAKYGDSDW